MNTNLKELKEVLVFGFDLVDLIPILGKKDYIALLSKADPLFKSAKAAIDNIGNPLDRFRSLTADERLELAELAKERFDIPDNDLEYLIEDTLDAVMLFVALADRWSHRSKTAA